MIVTILYLPSASVTLGMSPNVTRPEVLHLQNGLSTVALIAQGLSPIFFT